MTKQVGFGAAAAAAVALLLAGASAQAATVTNEDETAYVVEIAIGEKVSEVSINPGQSLDLCPDGCLLLMGDDELDLAEGNELVKISGGRMSFVE